MAENQEIREDPQKLRADCNVIFTSSYFGHGNKLIFKKRLTVYSKAKYAHFVEIL